MDLISQIGILAASYFIGSIPFGFIIVKIRTGRDIRDVQSGRTGGTNAMRAAGFMVGFATAILDIGKGAIAVWLAQNIPTVVNPWIETLSPIAAIMGHNYSIFLIQRGPTGKIRLGGGAGGATCLGGSLGLWPQSGLIIFVIAAFIFYFVGYASVTTLSVAFISTLIFTVRALMGIDPWPYALYGILAGALLVYSLAPNIRRLREGTERLHGFRARKNISSDE